MTVGIMQLNPPVLGPRACVTFPQAQLQKLADHACRIPS